MSGKYTYPKRLVRDDLPVEPGRTPADYEFRTVVLDRGTSRNEARLKLTEAAEYGKWELARTRLYLGGTRKVLLRRRIMRVQPTFFTGVGTSSD